jgi:hypothetical protein
LEEVVSDYFGTDRARLAIRKKVEALYPAHEVDSFTELFWQRIQNWRAERQMNVPAAQAV